MSYELKANNAINLKFTQYSVADRLKTKQNRNICKKLQRDRRYKNSPDTFTTGRPTRMPNSNTIFLVQFSKTSKTINHIQRLYLLWE